LKINEPYWASYLDAELEKPYFKSLESELQSQKKRGKLILPLEDRLFRAFDLTPLHKVKVVVLGQDPYPGVRNATGLAFSVPEVEKVPPTLRNILRELKSDYGIVKTSGDLTHWAVQGVFLLNTILTVEAGKPGSHKGIGWEVFTDEVLKVIASERRSMVYFIFGSEARKKKDLILMHSIAPVLIIDTPHPSPQSAHTGFFWSKPFSQANEFLIQHNEQPIDWSL
jgi:uracil-DNA glycosylase